MTVCGGPPARAQSVCPAPRTGGDDARPQRSLIRMPWPEWGFGVDIGKLGWCSIIPHDAASPLAVVALWHGNGLGRLRGGGLVLWTGG